MVPPAVSDMHSKYRITTDEHGAHTRSQQSPATKWKYIRLTWDVALMRRVCGPHKNIMPPETATRCCCCCSAYQFLLDGVDEICTLIKACAYWDAHTEPSLRGSGGSWFNVSRFIQSLFTVRGWSPQARCNIWTSPLLLPAWLSCWRWRESWRVLHSGQTMAYFYLRKWNNKLIEKTWCPHITQSPVSGNEKILFEVFRTFIQTLKQIKLQ